MKPSAWRDPPLLGEKDVLVLATGEGTAPGPGDEGREWLSASEMARYEGFLGDRDRHRYLLRTMFLRFVLGRLTKVDPAALLFEIGPWGKPRLVGSPADPIHFSLSHSHGQILLAISYREVGIDLERRDSLDDLDSMAARILHPDELRLFQTLAPEELRPAFYRAWTRKEAVLKARGEGFSREPATLCLGLDPHPMGEVRLLGDPVADSFGGLADLEAPPDFASAVCARGLDWRVVRPG
jgi:4'-phosphopantetheinyl transferase